MTSAATRKVGQTAVKRIAGSKPGPFAAFVAATIVGVAAGVATYRLLRG